MTKICAWCRKPLDDGSDSAAEAASGITHGICLSCADEMCVRLGKPRFREAAAARSGERSPARTHPGGPAWESGLI